jgi:hypothetical protein
MLEAEAVKKIASFLGAKRVLAQKTSAQPSHREPFRRFDPKVAARDEVQRISALRRLTAFLSDYRTALRSWRGGNRGVLFPAGTYLMRLASGVTCAGAG